MKLSYEDELDDGNSIEVDIEPSVEDETEHLYVCVTQDKQESYEGRLYPNGKNPTFVIDCPSCKDSDNLVFKHSSIDQSEETVASSIEYYHCNSCGCRFVVTTSELNEEESKGGEK